MIDALVAHRAELHEAMACNDRTRLSPCWDCGALMLRLRGDTTDS